MDKLISEKLKAGFVIAIAAVVVNAVISYRNINQLVSYEQRVTHTLQVLTELERTLLTLKDAENGQRGYILTGDKDYLQPYYTAVANIDQQLVLLKQLTADNPDQQRRLVTLEQQTKRQLDRMHQVITLRQTQGLAAAQQAILSGEGKQIMDQIRLLVAEMKEPEEALLKQRVRKAQTSLQRTAIILILLSILGSGLLVLLYWLIRRDIITRKQTEATLQTEKQNLEMRVAERTVELLQSNQQLQTELSERQRAQAELQVSQAQFAGILNIAEDAIISINTQQQIILFNQGAEKIFGYSAAEMLGQSLDLLLPARFTQVHHRHVADFEDAPVHARRMGERREIYGRRKDGTEFPAEASISKLKVGQETVFTVFLQDVTERKQIDRMKDEFVSVVSHELRTPLTSIHGSLGMLASGLLKPDSEQGKRMLQIAVDSTDRLVRLINDILDIERIESGRVKMEKTVCTVDNLITEAVNVVQPLADKAGVTLSITSIPIQIWADPDRIVQTLTNLLSNAIKFSSTGNTVWLSAEIRKMGKTIPAALLFTVKDQGRGIPADKLDSIFERFQQVDSSDSRNHEGTGLGLAICRSIVQQHGGQIWVESELGQGSTFSFTVPLQEGQTPEPPVVQEGARSGPLVLICDDNPDICTVLQTLLEQQQYRVIAVTSGQDAITQAAAQQPNVILLDLLMPNMNGWETMSALKEQPATQNIPIIICSICNPFETPPQNPNFVNWLSKPLNESLLLQSLQQTLAKPAGQIRVLLVEDDANLASVLMTLFEQHGMTAFHATTGREAIRLSQQINPDLLVLDLIIPEGDGFTVVEWLRQHNRLCNTPLVVYSAKDLDASERSRLRLGHTEFLSKGRTTIQEFEQRVMVLLQQVTPMEKG